uniref:cDNA FLJ50191, weakly similar to Homo sapiens RNA binding motif protein 18 (RBM18), mRNA n=1 Tax=Homo sapiens TaxID=9606 RepID=B4DS91_HUMAN|nr:unnamed protein product [Homo sapiens]
MEAETKTLPLENASILSEGSLQEGHRLWIGNLDPKITDVPIILRNYQTRKEILEKLKDTNLSRCSWNLKIPPPQAPPEVWQGKAV